MAITTSERIGVRVDIKTRKGATFHRRFHCQYYSGTTLLDFDLTQYSGATMQVKRKAGSPFAELTLSTDNGAITLGTEGRMDLELTAEVMDGIRSGEYHYDLYLSNSDYPKRDFMYGFIIIEDKITG